MKIAGGRKDAAITMRNQIKLRCDGPKVEVYADNLRLDGLKDEFHKRGSIE